MNTSPSPARPRLLLVEDDPVSAAFLAEGAALLELDVQRAANVASARAAGRADRFDLLLIDAHLPDGPGEDVLMALREAGQDAPALAHTAAPDADLRQRLHAAGFSEVLCKPLPIAELHAALRRHLHAGTASVWDDAAALAVLGSRPEQVAALRGMFLDELPGQRARIAAAVQRGDVTTIRDELHRLSASCGFVGATQLAAVVQRLRAAPTDAAVLGTLEEAIDVLLAQ